MTSPTFNSNMTFSVPTENNSLGSPTEILFPYATLILCPRIPLSSLVPSYPPHPIPLRSRAPSRIPPFPYRLSPLPHLCSLFPCTIPSIPPYVVLGTYSSFAAIVTVSVSFRRRTTLSGQRWIRPLKPRPTWRITNKRLGIFSPNRTKNTLFLPPSYSFIYALVWVGLGWVGGSHRQIASGFLTEASTMVFGGCSYDCFDCFDG